ncbi:MAG: hypothetical protein ACI4PH_07260 [Faecousia sp.]
MKRRLLEAYDAMMMPDSCAQRIERELERQTKARQRRRNVEVFTPPRRSGWALAAGLVCLVLVLSAGGTLLALNLSHPTAVETPEPTTAQPPVSETAAGTEPFVLTETGREFLADLCYYMPDWSGYASLNDEFWNDFLYLSFTNPNLSEDGKALTVCGETEFVSTYQKDLGVVGIQVKISRERVNDYVNLAMGCSLPEDFQPNRTGLSYADGYFYVSVSDFGSMGFTFREWEPHEEVYDTYALAKFDYFVDEPENVVATVVFQVYPAENANGFTVISKETIFIDDTDRQEIQTVVSDFAEAYFAGDTGKLWDYLEEDFAWQVEGYPSNGAAVSIENIRGLYETKQRQVGDVEVMVVEFLEETGADSFTYLTMELVKQEDGWKVKSYGLEK